MAGINSYSSDEQQEKREWKKSSSGAKRNTKEADLELLKSFYYKLQYQKLSLSHFIVMKNNKLEQTKTRIPPFPNDACCKQMRRGPENRREKANGFTYAIQRYSWKTWHFFQEHLDFIQRNIFEIQDEEGFRNNIRICMQAAFCIRYKNQDDVTMPQFKGMPEAINYLEDDTFLALYQKVKDPFHDTGVKQVQVAVERRAAQQAAKEARAKGNSQGGSQGGCQGERAKSSEKEKRPQAERNDEEEVERPPKKIRMDEEEERTVQQIAQCFLDRMLQENGVKVNAQVLLEQTRAKCEETKKQKNQLMRDNQELLKQKIKMDEDYRVCHKAYLEEEKRRIDAEEIQQDLLNKINLLEEKESLYQVKNGKLEDTIKSLHQRKQKILKGLRKRLSTKDFKKIKKSGIISPVPSDHSSSNESNEDSEEEPCPVKEMDSPEVMTKEEEAIGSGDEQEQGE